MIIDDEENAFESRDEALAYAIKMSEPGDVIAIHDYDCDVDECTCQPIEYIHGGAA